MSTPNALLARPRVASEPVLFAMVKATAGAALMKRLENERAMKGVALVTSMFGKVWRTAPQRNTAAAPTFASALVLASNDMPPSVCRCPRSLRRTVRRNWQQQKRSTSMLSRVPGWRLVATRRRCPTLAQQPSARQSRSPQLTHPTCLCFLACVRHACQFPHISAPVCAPHDGNRLRVCFVSVCACKHPRVTS